MKKVIKIILAIMGVVIVLLILAIGYLLVTGNLEVSVGGMSSDYEKLDKEQQERVHNAITIDSLKADGNVYRVTPLQVKRYLQGKGKVLVYSYTPYCNGKACQKPSDAEKKCEDNGMEILLIANNYQQIFENTRDYNRPVFVIDNKDVESRLEYIQLFYSTLTAPAKWSITDVYLYFNEGKYIKGFTNIEDAIKWMRK